MTRTTKDHNLSTPAARARLRPRDHAYFHALDVGVRIGYRRHHLGGRWVLSRYNGDGTYTAETIKGIVADDFLRADGVRVLSFVQAVAAVRELASAPPVGPTTVAQAMASYFKRLEKQGSKSFAVDQRRAKIHILPVLGHQHVDALTRPMLDDWLAAMVKGETPDKIRASRASANRTMTILKAALNQAFKNDLAASDRAWRACEAFRDVNKPRLRFFSRDEIVRLLNAATGDFRNLCKSALFSGARYSELGRLKVCDFETDTGTLYIGESKSGKPCRVHLTDEGLRFFETLVAGRAPDTLLLTNGGRPWLDTSQTAPMHRAMAGANVSGGSFHAWRHTHASHLLMSGCSMATVSANLGHASILVTERHYIHLSKSYRSEQIREFGPNFGTTPDTTTVVPLRLDK